ncbi:hypothetical protein [Nocardioides pantholopis]|uniref:hypothetical protein n=1 Tax=Nocardioides pantholopis TaxID=2483798 RepID=UPI000FD92575|nr:hypothetical protein [Nocardioides pantholopis]
MSGTVDVDSLGRQDSWSGVRAVVLGFGAAGFAAADNLLHLGAEVLALDPDAGDAGRAERAELLEVLGATVRLGVEPRLPDGPVDVVVVSPEWPDDSPLPEEARRRGVPLWGEVDLAWRLRDPAHPAPWLCAAGEPGGPADPARTARVLDQVLRAAGLRSARAGHGGLPLVEAVMEPEPYDVLAVALSPAQLRRAGGLAAESAVVLDVPADPAQRAALGRVYEHVRLACVYAAAVPATEELVREADVAEGARAIGITLGMPGVGMLGLVEDLLVDRAFIAERASSAAELGSLADVLPQPPTGGQDPDADGEADPDPVRHALAAAALARAHGVSQHAVRDGLRASRGR